MRIEIERFPDNRLKMKKTYNFGETNVRTYGDRVDVVPRNDEVKLEKDVLEAVNLWNLMHMTPELRIAIYRIIRRFTHPEELST